MKRAICAKIARKLLNEKGKRITFLTALYWLLSTSRGVEPDYNKLSQVINPHGDVRALRLPVEISRTVWSENVIKRIPDLPVNKLRRYIQLIAPCCLRYGNTNESRYSIDRDIDQVLALVAE